MAAPVPFIDFSGRFNESLVPVSSITVYTKDVVGETHKPDTYIELRYGVLSVIQSLCSALNLPMPALNKLVSSPAMFQTKLTEIIAYYGKVGSGNNLTSLDAYNYFRLLAVGGNHGHLPAWFEGLASGNYYAAGDVLIGVTEIVPKINLKNNEKDPMTGYWQMPTFVYNLSREFKQFRDYIVSKNTKLLDSDEYSGHCQLFLQIMQTVQGYLMITLKDTLVFDGFVDSEEDVRIEAGGLHVKLAGGSTMREVLGSNPGDAFRSALHPAFSSLDVVAPGWIEKTSVIAHGSINRWFKPA